MEIAIFAGEVSGDLAGASLARRIREAAPQARLWGIGGCAMRGAGVDLIADSSQWGAIGVVESVCMLPRLAVSSIPKVYKELKQHPPDVLVAIDFGAFNVRAARVAKRQGVKVCYYIPPGCWRIDAPAAKGWQQIADVVATPFQWAVERYAQAGVRSEFVGHPIIERVRPQLSRDAFANQFGLDPDRPIIGLLPGSRRREVESLLPVMVEAARLLLRSSRGAQFVLALASSVPAARAQSLLEQIGARRALRGKVSAMVTGSKDAASALAGAARSIGAGRTPALATISGVQVPLDVADQNWRARRWRSYSPETELPPLVIAENAAFDVMAHSDVLVVCSGTATLEAAVLATPMVIVYRGSRLMEMEYRLRNISRTAPFIGLPNILAGRLIVPELIQNAATPEAISDLCVALMQDPAVRSAARSALCQVRDALGQPGASSRTASLVLELAGWPIQ